jgi:hypothetical protein
MTHQKKQALNCRFRLMQWPWFCGLFAVVFAGAALAADPLYENDAVLQYTVPPQILPVIDATNFLNNNWFQIYFTTTKGGLNANAETYETEDTINFTNIGTMVTTSSVLTNNFNLILSLNPGCGFNFDTYNSQSGLESMAGSFYNPGSIRANSQVDLFQQAFLVSTVGKCLVNASNIVVPGTIDLGQNSQIKLTGKSVDLTLGTLMIEGGLFAGGSLGLGSVSAQSSGFGLDTNQDWNPGIDLTVSSALPSLARIGNLAPATWEYPFGNGIPFPTFFASPLPTTPYVAVTQVATNNFIYRYVFVDNTAPNVAANVYINDTFALPGTGAAIVELVGSYIDPSTSLPVNDYMYVRDDYALGANNPGINAVTGVPNNFTFTPSSVALAAGTPVSPGFLPLPNVIISNSYSFADVISIPTTVITNNPTTQQNVTNYLSQVLPGRIQISADNSLDLTLANISGQNYMQLRAPNQFNGSVGARIASPYSDIDLGVTNGLLTVTNLIQPYLPAWNGTIQAWSTRFFATSTNTIITFSNSIPVSTNSYAVLNDYRVLILANQALPTTPAEIQDLRFHGTNVVISDVLSLLRSLSIDAQNLTLTTNAPGTPSPDGELNMQSLPINGPYAFIWQNALPNLRNLTNSGAIRMPNVNPVNMGSSASPYGAFINHGYVAGQGVIIYATNFESDGVFSNSVLGSFILQSQTTTLTNGLLTAGGDVFITTGSLVTSNLVLQAGRSLKLTATNQLTDSGVTNGNVWTVGTAAISMADSGISLPILPTNGDLLGTTITLFAPAGKNVMNTWAGKDYGVSNAGYTNNVAIGHLILDALGTSPSTLFTNRGTGAGNAIYVDRLELRDYAGYQYHDGGGNLPALGFNTNLVIYYADAVDAVYGDVSVQINHKNNDHLRWVPTYAGYFSSTNLVYLGVTNAYNVALAQNTVIDSDGDGTANASDPTPFFLPSMINQVGYATNNPPSTFVISWNTIPLATNFVYYSTNIGGPFNQLFTNFISPQLRPNPATNVMVFAPMVIPPRYYQVVVYPWLTWPY